MNFSDWFNITDNNYFKKFTFLEQTSDVPPFPNAKLVKTARGEFWEIPKPNARYDKDGNIIDPSKNAFYMPKDLSPERRATTVASINKIISSMPQTASEFRTRISSGSAGISQPSSKVDALEMAKKRIPEHELAAGDMSNYRKVLRRNYMIMTDPNAKKYAMATSAGYNLSDYIIKQALKQGRKEVVLPNGKTIDVEQFFQALIDNMGDPNYWKPWFQNKFLPDNINLNKYKISNGNQQDTRWQEMLELAYQVPDWLKESDALPNTPKWEKGLEQIQGYMVQRYGVEPTKWSRQAVIAAGIMPPKDKQEAEQVRNFVINSIEQDARPERWSSETQQASGIKVEPETAPVETQDRKDTKPFAWINQQNISINSPEWTKHENEMKQMFLTNYDNDVRNWKLSMKVATGVLEPVSNRKDEVHAVNLIKNINKYGNLNFNSWSIDDQKNSGLLPDLDHLFTKNVMPNSQEWQAHNEEWFEVLKTAISPDYRNWGDKENMIIGRISTINDLKPEQLKELKDYAKKLYDDYWRKAKPSAAGGLKAYRVYK